MNRTISLTLLWILALVLLVRAQEPPRLDLARAIATARLQSTASDGSGWSRVGALPAGTTVVVTIGVLHYASRLVLTADESGITVLNLVDPALPYEASRVLNRLASRQPSYFATAGQPAVLVEGNVRVATEGVFVNGQRVTTLERLVETFARDEVTEITSHAGQAGTFMGDFGGLFAIGGALAGIIGGGMLGHRQFAHYKGLGATLGAVGGSVVGLGAGFAIMAAGGAFREDVIYRAP